MDVIKRQISFEPATVRYTGGTYPYGTMTADTFYVKIMLTQNMDDMGMFTDIEFTDKETFNIQPDYTILINKLSASGFTFPFMSGQQPPASTQPIDDIYLRPTDKSLDDYWVYGNLKITGSTDSKITDVRSYNQLLKYVTGFDVNKDVYNNYQGVSIDGRSRVTQQNIGQIPIGSNKTYSATTYVFDAENDANIGTSNQSTGILYRDFTGATRFVKDEFGGVYQIPRTEMEYTGEGWNETNTSLSALTKEEYLFGITQPPEVQSDVFIDRGGTTVFEKHLRLSEIESLEHLERYNNGFYKLVKQ
jgi:hypothetical protein